eukprot:scaffold189_cov118-Isochrysis_galbana.AAC.6
MLASTCKHRRDTDTARPRALERLACQLAAWLRETLKTLRARASSGSTRAPHPHPYTHDTGGCNPPTPTPTRQEEG